MNSNKYRYLVLVNSEGDYPADFNFVHIIDSNENTIAFSCDKIYYGDWGTMPYEVYFYEENLLPKGLFAQWLSAIEKKFYCVEVILPPLKEVFDSSFFSDSEFGLVVGLAPFGGLSLWIHNDRKSSILLWTHGLEIENEEAKVFPNIEFNSIKEYYDYRIINGNNLWNRRAAIIPIPHNHFDNYMKQFTYRYIVLFEHWDEGKEIWSSDCKSSQTEHKSLQEEKKEPVPELDYLEEALFDGTHDKLHDGGLMNYHEAGKPKKLAVQWHIKKSEYTAYFWFEDEEIRSVFDRFYGAHPDTKTDFMIRIDSEKKKIELALYRYGLKEPQIISESAYQLIVFKNKFEYFRSENYDQIQGAWIW